MLQKTVKHNGVYYKKVNGKWRYYGKSLAGRGKGWSFVHGYWFYDGYAYTMHKGEWFRYFQEAWHKFGNKLPAVPSDPRGKFRVESPTKPYWPKKKLVKKMVKKAPAPMVKKVVKKSTVKPVPKVTPKVKPTESKTKPKTMHSNLPPTKK